MRLWRLVGWAMLVAIGLPVLGVWYVVRGLVWLVRAAVIAAVRTIRASARLLHGS